MLFRDGLVMYDRETESLWTQVDGRGIQGPLAGQTLEPVAAVHATWRAWNALYPNSTVLRKRGVDRSTYEAYNRRPSALGIFGRRHDDRRLPAKERILGVRSAGSSTAFSLSAVRQVGLVQTQVGDLAVLLVARADHLPVLAYSRRVGDRSLTFRFVEDDEAVLLDNETGTTWRLADGVAVDGPLSGGQLERVVAHPAFWFGWQGYFPGSEVWQPRTP